MTIALSRSCLAGVCLLLFGLPFAHAADTRLFAGQSGTLDIAGGTAHIPVVEDVARQVGRANPQVRITVTGGGSGVGIQKVGEGLVDIGSTGRAPSEAEIQRYDLKPFRFALDGVAIAVHPSNPVGNLSMEQARDIFSGKIKKWDDASIAKNNDGVELPSLDIIPVNRADKSGTTENFTAYLAAAAPSAWAHEAAETWPIEGTQSAEKTTGVVQLATSTEGAITYADASQIKDLKAANIDVNGEFLAYSPEAAAALVDGSPASELASDTSLTFDLLRDGSIKDAYPIVMVSYLIGCQTYEDASTAANVQAYFTYVASAEGQQVATEAGAGNAPISEELRTKVQAAIDTIK